MDLFSIISLGLAIAALLLSFFMAWLSWEFYKKSAGTSEQTQQAVTKIEVAIIGVQSDITEIVRRAVGYWTSDSHLEVDSQALALSEKVEELSEKIKSISGPEVNKKDIEENLSELVRMQKEQIASINSNLLDAKAQVVFPSLINTGQVAQLTHTVLTNTETEKTGELHIDVVRQSKYATATGKFSPHFSSVPSLSVNLIACPTSNIDDVIVTSGVGNPFDFNVHLRARIGFLKTGTYVVKYSAIERP